LEKTFDDDWQAVAGEPLEVSPAHARVEAPAEEVALHSQVLRHLEVDADVALAPADIGHVDGEDERRVAVRDGLLDRRLRLGARTPDVDLEPPVALRQLFGSARRRGLEP